ncbi:hypothetical protein HPB50_009351 [Hyalomma asiaticum]|uniref:Uncharacterized protein n=1 Tax=Hyalomma asiaticum TaxID=266040 RepID=A0ACB7T104_HYAAI|nr:hypothetical protein HPB50_009351 [Hyalomma asiaticum]
MKTVLLGVLAAMLNACLCAYNVTTSAEERLLSLDFRHPETSTNLPEVCAKDAAWKAQFLCANRFYAHVEQAEDNVVTKSHDVCRHPETSTNLPEVCAKDAAWKAQFLCANRFYAHVEQAEDNTETESHDVCSSVSRFYICLDTVLHEQSCDHDAELMGPVEYFPRVLTHKYHKLCSAELGLTAQQLRVKVLRALGSSDAGLGSDYSICREEKAAREFFACGLLFNVIISSDPPKDKLCTAYRNMEKCTKDLQCRNESDFNTHSKHVLDALLSPYTEYCYDSEGAGKNATASALPGTTPPVTEPATSAVPVTMSTCSATVRLENYFRCGLMFIFNLRDARFPDESKRNDLVCELVRTHKMCVEEALRSPRCPEEIGIQKNLDYLDNQLYAATGMKCLNGKKARTGRKRQRSSAQHCHVRPYASTYFTCGAMFLRGTYLNRPDTGEACRLYNEFLKCIEELVVCRQQSDLEVSFRHFTEILTDGYKHSCIGLNRTGKQRNRAALAARQSSCDEFGAVKRLLLCGIAFHRMLPSTAAAGNGSSEEEWNELDNGTIAVLCPLVKEMKYCIYSATRDSGCSQAAFLSAEMLLTKQRLLQEFDRPCDDALPSKNIYSRPSPTACELKEFTEDWETCDATAGKDVIDFYRKGTALQAKGVVSKRQRGRLCSELLQHRRCMQESASRHYCHELAARLVDFGVEELLNKLGLSTCSSSPSRPVTQRSLLLLLTAGGTHVLARWHSGSL